ncbi:helix-turn-helix transcriptional regulator [Alteromonas sp. KUL49]|uniref:helix-turn-helix domain-containing protein n=1 Tax=Alteromonas sp. KUL49 TaxID=2480798 RepID=UPI00102F1EE4|nr:helix-turn-helix transcriptional regulator [Alteromonas sp. KUL49]TAP38742.1 XRE family transcriptional regulator [Alteromonas sp. KUL49]GEA12697.1 hypothetical protein KUL49_30720 [Alteromonas sp. KUL49]
MAKLGLEFDGSELKKLRTDAKLTQEEMAELLGLSRITIVKIEKNNPSTMKALSWKTITEWQALCLDRVGEERKRSFKQYLKRILHL